MRTRIVVWVALSSVFVLLAAACDECKLSADCGPGEACVNGQCQGSSWTGPDADTDTDTDTDTDSDTDSDSDYPSLTWVQIPGGTFMMGSDAADALTSEAPVHEVEVPSFEMTRTEVTVGQFAGCVADGECQQPNDEGSRNRTWGNVQKHGYPINYVSWDHADDFCAWAGGRLPSEAEWEFAARNRGQDVTYPWGEDLPDCDLCTYNEGPAGSTTGVGCGEGEMSPPCQSPEGNTEQGLCDMIGNVYEWVEDHWHSNYTDAPTDGSSWWADDSTSYVIRGGGYIALQDSRNLTATGRTSYGSWEPDLGFRCARDWTEEEPDGGVDGGPDGGV